MGETAAEGTPTRTFVVVQAGGTTMTVHENYLTRQAWIFGWIQVTCGILSVIFAVLGLALGCGRGLSGFGLLHGTHCGCVFIISGGLTLGAAKQKGQCLVVASLVLSIFASLACLVQIGFAALTLRTAPYYYIYGERYSDDKCQLDMVMGGLLVFLGVAEFIVAVWTSTLACRVICNGQSEWRSTRHPQKIRHPFEAVMEGAFRKTHWWKTSSSKLDGMKQIVQHLLSCSADRWCCSLHC